MALEIIRDLFSQATGTISRSSSLAPMLMLVTILAFATVGLVYAGAPDWVLYGYVGFVGLLAAAIVFGWFMLALKDPDALRSEKYSLSKLAIERSEIGDDTAGLLTYDDVKKSSIEPTLLGDDGEQS